MRREHSLSASLTTFAGAFVLILVTLSIFTAVQLVSIEKATQALGDRWMQTRNILGEIRTGLSQIRLAEIDRALATSPATRLAAEKAANEPRQHITELQAKYRGLAGGERQAEMRELSKELNAFFDAHDAWVLKDRDGRLDDPVRLGESLDRRYVEARGATTTLINENAAAAQADADRVDQSVRWMMAAVAGCLVAAVMTALLVMNLARSSIITPLVQITNALSKLAAGDRDIRLPQRHSMREIDAMVKAFAVFQANALALEAAHEATRLAQETAQSLARHDILTGLPNRRVFSAELDRVMEMVQAGEASAYVLLIDLDRFKPVNDLHGHAAGDSVLCEVALRLSKMVREGDVVARLGGDEFAVIARFPAGARKDAAIALGKRLVASLGKPMMVGDKPVSIGASIGIAGYRPNSENAGALLREADLAMYRAKRDGRGMIRFYEQSMDDALKAQAALEVDLRAAVREETIEPYFQPLVDMKTGEIFGFELLSRWFSQTRGWVSPDDFIPLAEQLGLISDLTWSTLRRACRAAKGWPAEIRLSINVSPIQLKDTLFPVKLFAILSQEGFSPHRLEVEVTESALVADIATAKAILTSMQNLGIKVSLDDFGTGYSSLYHLRELKFDKVKIDKSFVMGMREGNESDKIIDAILSLSRSLSLPTVAEGIEDVEVLKQLTLKGCEFGQGYYFGKAMSAADAAALLESSDLKRAVG